MDLLAPREHRHELGDTGGARVGLLRRVDAIKDGVTVMGFEGLEEARRARRLCESGDEVGRHDGATLRGVRGIPPAVPPRALDGGPSGWHHYAARDEGFGLLAVDLRPGALRAAGRETLPPPRVVDRALLAVDPSPEERALDRLGIRD